MSNRYRFMFSNTQAQKAEALKNAAEARAYLVRWVPEEAAAAAQAPAATGVTTTPGQCFKRVTAILAGRGKQ
jgi:hypothetical protein